VYVVQDLPTVSTFSFFVRLFLLLCYPSPQSLAALSPLHPLFTLPTYDIIRFDKTKLAFVPKDLEWIKQQLIAYLHIQSY
jgi:hypothetical protein